MTLLNPPGDTLTLPMPGLEPDNLLALLALLGLLRAIETARPNWEPRASWRGKPWVAQLHLAAFPEPMQIAEAAQEGILSLVRRFDVDSPRKKVDFTPDEYRKYAKRVRSRNDAVAAALASALTAECGIGKPKRDGRLEPSPLIIVKGGQLETKFFERLINVPNGALGNPTRKTRARPDFTSPAKIAEALFQPWRHEDDADGFRWDPEDDQRYALRYGDPGLAGAAPTVVGANRLAAIGFLSFSTVAGTQRMKIVGTVRSDREWRFIWPIWLTRLSRAGIEALLAHPDLLDGDRAKLRVMGVAEIFRARRVKNGNYSSVTRARPWD